MWHTPLPLKLVPTTNSESFKQMPMGHTGLPLRPHPGAFAVKRKHHMHEGVDLYTPAGTPVFAVETGEVKSVRPFTGPELGHGWWLPTWAVLVESDSGVVVYGEVEPRVCVGATVRAGDCVGIVVPVLKINKGRPTSMLHLELRRPNVMQDIDWHVDSPMPVGLLDPTQFLLDVC